MRRLRLLSARGRVLVAASAILAQSTSLYGTGPSIHAAPAAALHPVATGRVATGRVAPARLNPHLHGAAARPVKPVERPTMPEDREPDHRDGEHHDPTDKSKEHESRHEEWERWRHHWHYRWSYATWVVLHRGLGSVHGTAYNAAGVPTSGIHLALRWPGGEYIRDAALRHTTYSGANGSFTMTGVRLGEYRVRAQDGKTAGHTVVSVHPGGTSFVSVKV